MLSHHIQTSREAPMVSLDVFSFLWDLFLNTQTISCGDFYLQQECASLSMFLLLLSADLHANPKSHLLSVCVLQAT